MSDDEVRELIEDWERNRGAMEDARAVFEERQVHEREARECLLAAIGDADSGMIIAGNVLYRPRLVKGVMDVERMPVRVLS